MGKLGLSYGDYAHVTLPVLDMYGEHDLPLPLVLKNAAQRNVYVISLQTLCSRMKAEFLTVARFSRLPSFSEQGISR